MANFTSHYYTVAGSNSETVQNDTPKSGGVIYTPKQSLVKSILAYSHALRVVESAKIDSFPVFIN